MIIDAKTGKPGPADAIQVMTYMYAVPLALTQYRDVQFSGRVIYPDSQVRIPVSAVDNKFILNLGGFITRLASETPARKVPIALDNPSDVHN